MFLYMYRTFKKVSFALKMYRSTDIYTNRSVPLIKTPCVIPTVSASYRNLFCLLFPSVDKDSENEGGGWGNRNTLYKYCTSHTPN